MREHTTLVVIVTAYRPLLMPTPFWCFIVGKRGAGHSPATAGGPGTLLADVQLQLAGEELAASVREEESLTPE